MYLPDDNGEAMNNKQIFKDTARHALFALLVMCSAPWGLAADSGASDEMTAPRIFRDCEVCPELVAIPPGSFVMGSTDGETSRAGMRPDRAAHEKPRVPVNIAYPFAIGRYELTVAEFRVFADATGFEETGCFELRGEQWGFNSEANWSHPGFPVSDQHPAVCLNSYDFQAYLDWLSERTGAQYRFPTEAEWEYVARSGIAEVRIWAREDEAACEFQNGADLQYRQTFTENWETFECDDGFAVTAPVAQYQSNNLGMYDVFGNVAELTADCFATSHQDSPTDGAARVTEPCQNRVFKGGSWAGEPGYFRPAVRVAATPIVRGTGFGLRVLREIPRRE